MLYACIQYVRVDILGAFCQNGSFQKMISSQAKML